LQLCYFLILLRNLSIFLGDTRSMLFFLLQANYLKLLFALSIQLFFATIKLFLELSITHLLCNLVVAAFIDLKYFTAFGASNFLHTILSLL